jgi:hypothetical protein
MNLLGFKYDIGYSHLQSGLVIIVQSGNEYITVSAVSVIITAFLTFIIIFGGLVIT